MGALTITASLDASVTALNTVGNAAYDPTLYGNFTGAVNLAVQYFQNNFATIGVNVNVNIIFGWGSVTVPNVGVTVANGTTPNTGGVSPTSAKVGTFADVKTFVTTAAAQPNASAAQITAWNLISSLTTDPTNGGQFTINPGQIKILDPNYQTDGVGTTWGVTANGIDGGSVINSTWNWNWTQTGFTTNQFDAVSVEEHEISEVLGRSMSGGVVDAGSGKAQFTMMDFYDYSAAGNPAVGSGAAAAVVIGGAAGSRNLTVTAAANPPQTYFSANGTTVGLAFAVPASAGDIADWSSPAADAFGGGGPGAIAPVSATDQLVLNVLGLASAACYASGTMIATRSGPVAVEALREGDAAMLAAGGHTRVKWIGHRQVACARHPRPQDVMPVRVQRDAFAAGQPARDLLLSPDHSVFVDGVLIPVRYLLNGASIRQETVAEITYWHVELDHHDVILAEGLPCESYLDTGNRGAFANGGPAVTLHPDFALNIWEAEACARLVVDGAELEAVRSLLLERAVQLGHVMTDAPDLHLLADGRRIAPTVDGAAYCFALPHGVRRVRLLSRHGVPAHMFDANPDHRRLGVGITACALDDMAVALDDARLGAGWHASEGDLRWTDGAADIAVGAARRLRIELRVAARSWLPAAAGPRETHAGRA